MFPVAWVFGRSGCSVVHDHPGMKATAGTLLAVAFGRPERIQKILSVGTGDLELRWGNAPQFDLGLLEMMFTVVLATLLALTWRKKLTTGSYVAATALCYAPVRFAMDFLRVRDVDQADPRYGMPHAGAVDVRRAVPVRPRDGRSAFARSRRAGTTRWTSSACRATSRFPTKPPYRQSA